MSFPALVGALSGFLYSKLLIVILIVGGLYFTFRTGFIQFRFLKESLRVVLEKPHTEGAVSSFQALMVSTGSRVGTGNIVGVATAICTGGYGAVFWMWLIAIIGGASAFVESTLAQIYKRRHPDGSSYGGPAYYIEDALGSRSIGWLFAFSMLLTYAGGFNMLCSYNLQSTFSAYSFYDASTTPWIIGGITALVVFWCLVGGGSKIIKASSAIVPFMGGLYILVALIITIMNITLLPGVIVRIFTDAFDVEAIFGGFSGSCVMMGIKRGLFSNEAGVGSAPNAAAAADVSHPVKQGLVQMLSVFIDTLLICTATALMCLCSGIEPAESLGGAPYVQLALSETLGFLGPMFITLSMVLFAFTTLIGNLFYVDNLLIYLLKRVPSKAFLLVFRLVAAGLIFLGAGLSMGLVWDIADVLMGVMVLINIPVILLLDQPVILALEDYTLQKKAGKNPVFRSASIDLAGKTEYWQ